MLDKTGRVCYTKITKRKERKKMMHDFTELFHIKGNDTRIFSAAAVQFVNHVPQHRAKIGDCYSLNRKVATAKPFRIFNNIDSKDFHYGYQYGERLWFDTAEELAQFRAEEQERARLARIEKAKKEIEKNLKILAENA